MVAPFVLSLLFTLFQQPLQDNGVGVCPAFQHSHAEAPGSCFSDDDDALLIPDSERRRLPKRETQDGGGPSDESVQAAVDSVADKAEKFKFYLRPEYEMLQFDWQLIETVKDDIAVCGRETDHAKFLLESDQLTVDFGILDAYDDMLRRSRVI